MQRVLDHAPPAMAFAVFGAAPALALIAGAMTGGPWLWAGLIWIALIAPAADSALARGFGDAAKGARFPAADAGLVLLAICHALLMAAALAGFAGDHLGAAQRVALFLGAGMYFGQVSNAVAHELIHRPRGWHGAGAAIYVSLLFGHHASAHRLVHHAHVATDADPNSARPGESFWRFLPRAWVGSFRAGLAAEQVLSARKPGRMNPYHLWIGGAVAMIGVVGFTLGPRALADYLGLCAYAQMQLLLSDYVQHYGLRRRVRDGRAEPVGPQHSWDSPHPISSLTLVNAPRHSDHHLHPSQAYPGLRLGPRDRPMLPAPLALMGAIAMLPPLWHRVMDHRVDQMRPRM